MIKSAHCPDPQPIATLSTPNAQIAKSTEASRHED
jgi:hypothetical protein